MRRLVVHHRHVCDCYVYDAGGSSPSRDARHARGRYSLLLAVTAAAALRGLSPQHVGGILQLHSYATCCSVSSDRSAV